MAQSAKLIIEEMKGLNATAERMSQLYDTQEGTKEVNRGGVQ